MPTEFQKELVHRTQTLEEDTSVLQWIKVSCTDAQPALQQCIRMKVHKYLRAQVCVCVCVWNDVNKQLPWSVICAAVALGFYLSR